MKEVKLYKSLDNNIYETMKDCLDADKKYLIHSLFINKVYDNNLQTLFNKGNDEFWSELKKKIETILYNNIDEYIQTINIVSNNNEEDTQIENTKITKNKKLLVETANNE